MITKEPGWDLRWMLIHREEKLMKKIILILGMFLVVSGCSPLRYTYREIQKDKQPENVRVFSASGAQLQKALIEMLLLKQFSIDKEDDALQTIVASRYFSRSHNNTVVVLQARIFMKDQLHQELFLNAIQTTQRNYVVDRTRFLLWVIPLPGGGGKQVSKTKEVEVTISDKVFYVDLFDAIGKLLVN